MEGQREGDRRRCKTGARVVLVPGRGLETPCRRFYTEAVERPLLNWRLGSLVFSLLRWLSWLVVAPAESRGPQPIPAVGNELGLRRS